MRISRLRLHDFRGWPELDLRPHGHVLLVGVPRAGRSDIIAALIRLLDPAGVRLQPALADIRQMVGPQRAVTEVGAATAGGPASDPPATESDDKAVVDQAAGDHDVNGDSGGTHTTVHADYAEVEVTLIDLDPELEQLCDGFLEPLDDEGQVDDTAEAVPEAPLGVRLSYRVSYDLPTDTLEHIVFYPVRSSPDTGQYARVPAAVRRALPVVVFGAGKPLQLRAEGTLRRLVTDREPSAAAAAFRDLASAITSATAALSADSAIASTVDTVLSAGGIGRRLAGEPVTSDQVRFLAEDGSLSALLRAVQPALQLDDDGLLALRSHGSTVSAVLSAAEALVLAGSVPGAVVLGDDVGDELDVATTEHLAAVLRETAAQVWLSTRRPETARAFAPGELVRLTRRGGVRACFSLPPVTNRKEIAIRRLLHTQLLPALTAPTVAITEGPHDLTSYAAVDRRRVTHSLPLSAHGVRLVTADNGSGGGTGQIPRVADLARALGFRVVAVIDDTPDTDLPPIEEACDAVVQLPAGMAIERAIVAGASPAQLSAAAAALPAYGVPDPTIGKAGDDVAESLVQPLHKHGLHEQFLEALILNAGAPPVITNVLDAVATAAKQHYSGPAHIVAPGPPPPASPAA